MFCVGCGTKLEEDWWHCPNCGRERSQRPDIEGAGTLEYVSVTDDEALAILEPTSFAHWLASGRPNLIYLGDNLVQFDLTDPDNRDGYVRFGRWIIENQDIRDWAIAEYPFIEDFYEDYEPFTYPGGTPLTSEELENHLTAANHKIWEKCGRPNFVLSEDGTLEYGDIASAYMWELATKGVDYDDLYDFLDDDWTPPATEEGPASEEVVPYSEVKKLVSAKVYAGLLAAGKPDMVMRNGSLDWRVELTPEQEREFTIATLNPETAQTWIAAGEPPIDEFNEELEAKHAAMEARAEGRKVRKLTSDSEVKKWAGPDAYKVWKQRGKPTVVVVDEETAMYEVQWDFYLCFGYDMSAFLVDVWYFAGSPGLLYWDVDASIAAYRRAIG